MTTDRPTREPPASLSDNGPRTGVGFALPLLGTLFWTYGTVWWLCVTPMHGTLGWAGVVRTAGSFLLVTATAHALGVAVNRRLFRAHVEGSAGPVLLLLWPAVVWVPLLVLLLRESSPWRVVLPAVIAVSCVAACRTWLRSGGLDLEAGIRAEEADKRPVDTSGLLGLLAVRRERSFVRAMIVPVAVSSACHAAVGCMAGGLVLLAGYLLAAAMVWPAWFWSGLNEGGDATGARTPQQAAVRRTLVVSLLLVLALLPYLGSGRIGGSVAALLGTEQVPPRPKRAKVAVGAGARMATYSGVILLTPRKRREELQVPQPRAADSANTTARRPLLIPFDGAYWYFKAPDDRPRADAPVVQGDPRERLIRSTDEQPLLMEAHQRLGTAIPLDCCRGLRLRLVNADARPGAITVGVRLRKAGAASRSLGQQLLVSSLETGGAPERVPVEETVQFAFPAGVGHDATFDEIVVMVRPAWGRAQAGARVAVLSFELMP